MAKRFVDNEIWKKEWFQDLSLKHKILIKYIFENCDIAGVMEMNYRLASFLIGEKITKTDIEEINNAKEQFYFIDNNKIYIRNYIEFQYGTLSENCKPHKPVIEKLKKYGIYERFSKGFTKGIDTLEEQEQEQEEEQEEEQGKEQGKKKEKEISNSDMNCYGSYMNVVLTTKQYNQLLVKMQSKELLDKFIEELGGNIEQGTYKNDKPYNDKYPNAHYERLSRYFSYWQKHKDDNGKSANKEGKAELLDKLYGS